MSFITGYHASHEQFPPSELLKLVQLAEASGFQAINSSDHFHPWSERQGHSGFSFAWLGAAMQVTTVPYSVVCSPGQRYHPAIIAQATATLAEMFEGRFTLCPGSGEALNENITGDPWISKPERNQRLMESVNVIKRLLTGESVTHHGMVKTHGAKLYSLPKKMPLMIGAAVTANTAAWLASWADGLITISRPINELKIVVDAFRNNGGAGKPIFLKVQLSYSRDEEKAMEGAYDQWRTNVLESDQLDALSLPEHFDKAASSVTRSQLARMVDISADTEFLVDKINQYASLGFERIILHNVNRDQQTFIRDFSERVLPKLKY